MITLNPELILRSILLGAGLAMDAFSVSLADGLDEPGMKKGRMLTIAGTFAAFQFAMPLIGWVLVKTAVERFGQIERFVPWIALILLLYIGGKMLIEGIRDNRAGNAEGQEPASTGEKLTAGDLIIQGIATSIDALSVGFTIERYGFAEASVCAIIIGVVTLMICFAGLDIGKKIGTRISGKASIAGGIILIFIGLEIFVRGI